MTYRKCNIKCMFFMSIGQFVRRVKWHKVKRVSEAIKHYDPIITHFANGRY